MHLLPRQCLQAAPLLHIPEDLWGSPFPKMLEAETYEASSAAVQQVKLEDEIL